MMRLIPATFLLWHLATQAAPAPDDFAYGFDVTLDGEAAIYRLPLPAEVYRHVAHSDLSDIRVFTAAGESVPHTVRRAPPDKSREETATELPFFPLPASPHDPGRPLSVQVTRDTRGAVVRVEDRPAARLAERPHAYLIDTSQLERPPDALELEWTDAQANFVTEVGLLGSDDLVRWQTLVGHASVARLHFAGRLLERRRIEMPRREFRYLRLDWPTAAGTATLSRVKGWFREPLPEARRGWLELDGVPVEGDRPTFDYELPAHVPVDRVGVSLPPGNALLAVTISSRHREGEWRVRHRGAFYRVKADGAELIREDAGISATGEPYWRITLESNAGTTTAPRLRLGWVLDDLYFLARGDGPYTLAYGAADVFADPAPVDALLGRIDEKDAARFISTAQVGESRTLGGPLRLRPAPRPLPWQQIVLWSVLVLGVLGLGTMAWRLWRQMQQDKPRG